MHPVERAFILGKKALYKAYWTMRSATTPQARISESHFKPADMTGLTEFVRRVEEPALIEPEWGYIISRRGRLIKSSVNPNFPYYGTAEQQIKARKLVPLWRIGIASPPAYRALRQGRGGRIRHFPLVVSLRHYFDYNFYHFYFDVLGKLKLLHDCGIGPHVPIVLGPYAGRFSWARQILAQGGLADYTWIIPEDDCYISADKIIYCRTRQDYRPRMDFVMDAMGAVRKPAAGDRRIFLLRRSRRVMNHADVCRWLEPFGFEPVDTAEMTIPEQMALFSETRYLVGTHGAGMANLMFRREAPLEVLDLHPRGHAFDDFERICREYGYGYASLAGEPDSRVWNEANFTIARDPLEEQVTRMLAVET